MEELRQRDANLTALQAIGPRKKLKLDSDAAGVGVVSNISLPATIPLLTQQTWRLLYTHRVPVAAAWWATRVQRLQR